LLIFFPFCLFKPAYPNSGETGILWGQVVDQKQVPLAGTVIKLVDNDPKREISTSTDESGYFSLAGIPVGLYTLRVEAAGFEAQTTTNIAIEPSGDLYLKFALRPKNRALWPTLRPRLIDSAPLPTRTTISAGQIENLPTGHSIWSLIENQDFSATTNRIDVGGLWETQPALFSARGATSWTQNTYVLNGMDVTDPYWTGLPLFIPDFFSLAWTQLSNAAHPPQALYPGGYFTLAPKDGSPEFHGGFSGFYSDKKLAASNITPALEEEGIRESNSFNRLGEYNLHLSGPLGSPRWRFFTSWSALSVSRNIADYEDVDTSELFSGLVNIEYLRPRSTLKFFWTGQIISNPSFGAARDIPFVSTSRQKSLYNVFQIIQESNPRERTSYRLGVGLAQSDVRNDFQNGAQSVYTTEVFKNIPSGSAPFAGRDERRKIAAFFDGKSVFPNVSRTRHLLEYGIQTQYNISSSEQSTRNNRHLHFFDGQPLEIVFFDSPIKHSESSIQVDAYAQETITFPSMFSAFFSLNADWSYGWNAKADIQWLNLSPRFGLNFPLSRSRTSFIRISAARYYFTLPLNYLTYGNPGAPGGLVYAWRDANADKEFQENERGNFLRREGPLYGGIDSKIKRPHTDEIVVSLVHDFGAGWFLTLAGFLRETKNLVETINTGVPFSDYVPVPFYDQGDDRIPGTPDDLNFTVYNQKAESLGRDFFLLTNPDAESRTSRYKGLDLTLVKRYGSTLIFFLALTATEAVGTTSPGNTEWENDDGLVGSLYDNPNAAINARGRLRFDRAYTGRIGLSFLAPLGTRLSAVVKYYDGQPFARKIIVRGLNQGPFYIQAHPRGVSRYEFNMTLDVRLEKKFAWRTGAIRLIVDAFNVFNSHLATAENEWTGPEFPRRFATEIQSPRVFRLGLNFEF
jgi:hypothetical protein